MTTCNCFATRIRLVQKNFGLSECNTNLTNKNYFSLMFISLKLYPRTQSVSLINLTSNLKSIVQDWLSFWVHTWLYESQKLNIAVVFVKKFEVVAILNDKLPDFVNTDMEWCADASYRVECWWFEADFLSPDQTLNISVAVSV